ncbi:TAXI family TRAP transporter solute-binding subunit [Planctomycetota bacterium]
MSKLLATKLTVLAVLLAAGHGVAGDELRIAAGPKASLLLEAAEGIATTISERAVLSSARPVVTSGSADALRRLAACEVDLALVSANVLRDAYTGDGVFEGGNADLRAVAVLHNQWVHVVARKGLKLADAAELKGRHIAVGRSASGTASAARLLLDAHMIGPGQFVPERLVDAAVTLQAFRAQEIDAFFAVDRAPSALVTQALAAGGSLVAVDTDALGRAVQGRTDYDIASLPGGAYGLAEDTPALVTNAALVTRSSVGEGVIHDLLEALLPGGDAAEATQPTTPPTEMSVAVHAPVPLHDGAAQYLDDTQASPEPIKVFVGLYLYTISELDLFNGTFLVDGYIWFRWKGRLFGDRGGSFEFTLINGSVEKIDDAPVARVSGWSRQSRRFRARLRASFDLKEYPFDTQVLPLVVEHRWLGSENMVFVPDDAAVTTGSLRDSFLSPRVTIGDLEIREVRHRGEDKVYETDFGVIGTSEWSGSSSRYVFEVEVERHIPPYLLKWVLPLAIVVAMCCSVFWTDPEYFDAKIILGFFAFLSCVELHAYHSEHLPDVGMVRGDIMYLVSYLSISLTVLHVVVESWLVNTERHTAHKRLNRISRIFIPLSFAVPVSLALLLR